MKTARYVLISPVRNESVFLPATIASVMAQTVTPLEWVIVDDGSTDGTPRLAEECARKWKWVKLVSRRDRGFDRVGQGIAEAFNEGLHHLAEKEWEFIVKLDGDLSFEPDYFEHLFALFESDPALGISAGTSYIRVGNRLCEEKKPLYFPPGIARTYRRKCFEEIGGIANILGWDTIDIIRAQMHGWRTFRAPALRLIHLRTVSSRNGLWEGKVRTGRNFYITGYHPLFLLARCCYHLLQRPFLVDGIGVLSGYLHAALRHESRVVTPEEKAFLRRMQRRRLLPWGRASDLADHPDPQPGSVVGDNTGGTGVGQPL